MNRLGTERGQRGKRIQIKRKTAKEVGRGGGDLEGEDLDLRGQ